MSDDDKTAKDEPAADAAEDAAEEPEAEAKEDGDEKPAEDASTDEPKAEDPAVPVANAAQSAGTDQQGRQLYNVKCSNCGKDTQVPFQPSGDRPVYCRDCYMQKKNA